MCGARAETVKAATNHLLVEVCLCDNNVDRLYPSFNVFWWLEASRVLVRALFPSAPTCTVAGADGAIARTTIDYAVATHALGHILGRPYPCEHVQVPTHVPQKFAIQTDHLQDMVDVIKLAPRSSPTPVIGPHWP